MNQWKLHEDKLKDAGVKTDRLAVLYAGSEVILGEVPGVSGSLVNRVVAVENPKRVLTLKMQTPQGIAMNTFIGPMDLIEGGVIDVFPFAGFKVEDASADTKERIFGLYAQHLDEERQNRAMQAGIELAPGPLRPPNGLPNPNGLRGALR